MCDLPDIHALNTRALGIHIRQVNMLQLVVTISHHLQQCVVSIYTTSVYSWLVRNKEFVI